MDKAAGVDCKSVLQAAANSRARSAAPKQRFQEGAVDEVSILGECHPSVFLLYLFCRLSLALLMPLPDSVMLGARHGCGGFVQEFE